MASGPAAPLSWWRELVGGALFYGLYSVVRDIRGGQPGLAVRAFTNARRVIAAEHWLGVYHERALQHVFLRWRGVVEACNDFYATAHFVVPLVVLVVLYRRHPGRYRRWRDTLAIATGSALAGFAYFPLMPPRLLPSAYHFVDTLATFGGLWSFESGPVSKLSNQFAAMPSLHVAWAIWCCLAIFPLVDRLWAKAAAAAYPAVTVLSVVVTANHYFADVAGGLVVVAGGYVMAGLARAWRPGTTERWTTCRTSRWWRPHRASVARGYEEY